MDTFFTQVSLFFFYFTIVRRTMYELYAVVCLSQTCSPFDVSQFDEFVCSIGVIFSNVSLLAFRFSVSSFNIKQK